MGGKLITLAIKETAAKPRPKRVGRYDVQSLGDWWYVLTAGANHEIVHSARTEDEAV